MQLQVPIVNTRICRNLHIKVGACKKLVDDTIHEDIICAGGVPGEGTWKGDSGGPLMLPVRDHGSYAFYQIGIISCSFGCGRPKIPGIYTKVQHYADWIKKHVKE